MSNIASSLQIKPRSLDYVAREAQLGFFNGQRFDWRNNQLMLYRGEVTLAVNMCLDMLLEHVGVYNPPQHLQALVCLESY